MATNAIFSREEIERTLVNRMRVVAIDLGVLPDVRLFVGNLAGYKVARSAIVTGGNQLVDIFGLGSNQSRGEKLTNRVFINARQINQGETTHWGDSYYADTSPLQDGSLFSRKEVRASTKNIVYDVRTVVQQTTYDRLCTEVVLRGLTGVGVGIYVPVVLPDFTEDPARRFLLQYQGSQEVKTPKFFERLYTFRVANVWLEDWDVINVTEDIVPLTQVLGYGPEEGNEEGGADELNFLDVEP